jgi:hypothetical protein
VNFLKRRGQGAVGKRNEEKRGQSKKINPYNKRVDSSKGRGWSIL